MGQSSQSEDASGPPPAVLALCPPPLTDSHTGSLVVELPEPVSTQPLSYHLAAWRLLPGVSHDPIQIHSPVPPEPSLLQSGLPHCHEQCSRNVCSAARSDIPPPEGRDRGGFSFGLRLWLLQPPLSHPKEGWGYAPHIGSASPEFFLLQREIQDADVKNYPDADSNRGLVRHRGPEGRLFSYPP